MAISDYNYNTARTILINVGSQTANASRSKHTEDAGSPESYGMKLLHEARDEFKINDVRQANLQSEMTIAHFQAIHRAANQMGIINW
jgi:hypothetical protein